MRNRFKKPLVFISWIFTLLCLTAAEARDWEDLYAEDTQLYGREKDEKFPIQMFFFEREKWERHSSFHIFWLIGAKDYPRYQSQRFLPLSYSIDSKIDNRSYLLTPVYYGETDLSSKRHSLLWLFYWGGDADLDSNYTGLVPLFFHSRQAHSGNLFLSPLVFYYSSNSGPNPKTGTVQRQAYLLSPVFSHESLNGKNSSSLFWLFYWGGHEDGSSARSSVIPLYYYSRNSYATRKSAENEEIFFLSPLYLYDLKNGNADCALFWFIYWGSKTPADGELAKSYSTVLPFYYFSSSLTKGTSFYTLLFYYHSSPSSGQNSTKDSREETNLYSPLFFYETLGGKTSAALFWLIYWGGHANGRSGHSSVFPLYYFSRNSPDASATPETEDSFFLSPIYLHDRKQGDADSALLWLGYWGRNTQPGGKVLSSYSTILPIYYHSNSLSAGRFLLTPLFYYRSLPQQNRISTGKSSGETYFYSPFFLHESAGGKTSSSLFLLLSWGGHSDGSSGRSSLFPVYYYSRNSPSESGKANRDEVFFLSPIFFYDLKHGRADSALFWFIFWGGHDLPESESESSYSGMIPIFYQAKRPHGGRFLLTPLFIFSRRAPDKIPESGESTFFLSPIFLHHSNRDAKFNALFWLIYWGKNTTLDKHHSMVLPLWYYSKGQNNNVSLLTPFLTYNSQPKNLETAEDGGVGRYSVSLLWLAYWGADEKKSYTSILPLFYSSRSLQARFLISPIFLHHSASGDDDSALFWLFYWGRKGKPDSSYFMLLPLVYTNKLATNYRRWISPLFTYESTAEHQQGRSGSWRLAIPIIPILQFKSMLNETDFNLAYLVRHHRYFSQVISYAPPLYFHQSDSSGSFSSILFPLIWQWSNARESRWLVLPFMYSLSASDSKVKVSPVYLELSDSKSQFRLFLPIYVNYKNDRYSFHLNLTGISFSEEQLTHFPFSAEVGKDKILVDWDFGWLYNLIRVSSRTTIKLNEPLRPDPIILQSKKESLRLKKARMLRTLVSPYEWTGGWSGAALSDDEPELLNRRARTRQDSTNFFGTYALFGVFAYEKADHYRHFRLLPLSWLTWGEHDDEKVQMVLPLYLKYSSKTAEYLAIFPLYGYQEKSPEGAAQDSTCRDKVSAFLVILYWYEHDCRSNATERTAVWPLFNTYQSPREGGTRLLPLFWTSWHRSGETQAGWHFSLLHHTAYSGETIVTRTWIGYLNSSKTGYNLGIWGLLHFGQESTISGFTGYIFPVYYSGSRPQQSKDVMTSDWESTFTLAGIFWRLRGGAEAQPEVSHYSPLYILHTKSETSLSLYSWLLYLESDKSKSTFGIPFLLHRRSYDDDSYSNFFFGGFYYSSEKDPVGRRENLAFLPPIFYLRSSPRSSLLLLPGFARSAHYQDLQSGDSSLTESWQISPLHFYTTEGNNATLFAWIFWAFASPEDRSFHVPLIFHVKKSYDAKRGYLYLPAFYHGYSASLSGKSESTTWIFPLFYEQDTENDSRWQITPLYEYHSNVSGTSIYSWLFYYSQENQKKTVGFPLLWKVTKQADQPVSLVYLFPFYWSRTAKDSIVQHETTVVWLAPLFYIQNSANSSFLLLPGFARGSDDSLTPGTSQPETVATWQVSLLHIYLANSRERSLYTWLFAWSASAESWSFHLPLVFHRKHQASGRSGYLYLPLFYHSYNESTVGGASSTTWLFPFYYGEKDADRETWQITPLYFRTWGTAMSKFYSWLFYYTTKGKTTTFGSPLLWSRSTSSDTGSSSFYFLLFYWSRTTSAAEPEGRMSRSWLFPLWYQSSGNEERTVLAPGLYIHQASDADYYIVPLIFHWTSENRAQKSSLDLLMWSMSAAASTEAFSISILYGLLFRYEKTPAIFDWHFSLILGHAENQGEQNSRNHLLPLWWSSYESGTSRLYLPPLLSYFQSEANGQRVLRLLAFGSLYYQNADFSAHDQTLAVLMGLVYYHNMRTERMYDAHGSLLGLLWKYETEQGYEKFSVLSFMYSRTVIEDRITHRVFGIPIN